MDIRQLRYALALAEHQHFGRAAAAVGIAQPPLSKAIAQLEGEVGTRLFDRTRQGVFPTAAGEALLAPARRIDQELTAAALDAPRAARGATGRLRTGFITAALLSMLPPVLRRFRAEHPEVRLQLQEMVTVESSRALGAGELEVFSCRGAPGGRATRCHPLPRRATRAWSPAAGQRGGQPRLPDWRREYQPPVRRPAP